MPNYQSTGADFDSRQRYNLKVHLSAPRFTQPVKTKTQNNLQMAAHEDYTEQRLKEIWSTNIHIIPIYSFPELIQFGPKISRDNKITEQVGNVNYPG